MKYRRHRRSPACPWPWPSSAAGCGSEPPANAPADPGTTGHDMSKMKPGETMPTTPHDMSKMKPGETMPPGY